MIVVRKAAKEVAKKMDVRFPDSAVDELDKKITALIKEAANRAKKNGRVTIKEFDF